MIGDAVEWVLRGGLDYLLRAKAWLGSMRLRVKTWIADHAAFRRLSRDHELEIAEAARDLLRRPGRPLLNLDRELVSRAEATAKIVSYAAARKSLNTVSAGLVLLIVAIAASGLLYFRKWPVKVLVDLEVEEVQLRLSAPWTLRGRLPGSRIRVRGLSDVLAPIHAPEGPNLYFSLESRSQSEDLAVESLALGNDTVINITRRGTDIELLFTCKPNPSCQPLDAQLSYLGHTLMSVGQATEGEPQPKDSLDTDWIRAHSLWQTPVPVNLHVRSKQKLYMPGFPISDIRFSRLAQSNDPDPGHYESTAVEGRLQVLDVDRGRAIRRGEFVRVADINFGRLDVMVTEEGKLHVTLDAHVGSLAVGPDGFEDDERPRMLEYLAKGSPIPTLWGFVVAFGGMLWLIRHFLSL